MRYNKKDRVLIETGEGKREGVIKDRFIQATKLDYDGKTLHAEASAENPVYLIELDDGTKKMVAEKTLDSQ